MTREIDATAWAVSDVRRADEALPLAVVVLPPKKVNRESFDAAVRVFQAVEAQVIEESQLEVWAGEMAEKGGNLVLFGPMVPPWGLPKKSQFLRPMAIRCLMSRGRVPPLTQLAF